MSRRDDGMNPYAPSSSSAAPELMERPAVAATVSSTSLYLWTIGVCSLSGCLFGLASVAALLVFASLDGVDGDMPAFIEMVLFTAMGTIAGGLLGLMGALPSVTLILVAGIPWRKTGHRWNSTTIGRFAALSGLLAGFLPLTLVSGLDADLALFSIVPAIFGCFAARLLIIPLARKAGRPGKPLSSQPLGNYADN